MTNTEEEKEILLPPHMIFHPNNGDFLEDIDTAAALQDEVADEFIMLEKFVRDKIDPNETFFIGSENMERNRYRDMLPYDSNLIELEKPTGKR